MKEFLSREGVAFEARNIEEDDAAYGELLALGVRGVPATVIGAAIIQGFDQQRLREALAAAASGPSADP